MVWASQAKTGLMSSAPTEKMGLLFLQFALIPPLKRVRFPAYFAKIMEFLENVRVNKHIIT